MVLMQRPAGVLLSLTTACFLCTSVLAQPQVGRYDVFEHVINEPSAPFNNVWDDVAVLVTLTPPSGGTRQINGFFYDTDDWRFRVAPDEVGTWGWSYELRTQAALITTGSGSFECVPSNNPGFVRRHPTNPYRWVFDDGTPFHPMGMQDCLAYDTTAEYRIGDGEKRVFPEYLTIYSEAGFNLWRLGVDNCSFRAFQWFGPNGNAYDDSNLRVFDQYIQWIRASGMRVFFTLMSYNVPFGLEASNEPKMNSVKRYYSYMIARYAAYVDFWEIANEVETFLYSQSWLQQIYAHIKANDPYGHEISMSWARAPAPQTVDIYSPHFFTTVPPTNLANYWNAEFNGRRSLGKPVMYGELGNNDCNNSPNTAFRWRVASWIAFFKECSFVFWNTAGTTHCQFAANVDMDQEFRDQHRALANFSSNFDPDAAIELVELVGPGVVGWALDGPRDYGLYLYSQGNPTGLTTGVLVAANPQTSGTGVWIRPVDGAVLGSVSIPSGFSLLSVPDFTGDIALKMSPEPLCQPSLGYIGPGNARLSVCGGNLSTGTTADLLLSNAPPGEAALLLVSRFNTPFPWMGGTILPLPADLVWGDFVGANGEVRVPPGPGGGGPADVFMQFVYTDPSQTLGWGFSNALRLHLLP